MRSRRGRDVVAIRLLFTQRGVPGAPPVSPNRASSASTEFPTGRAFHLNRIMGLTPQEQQPGRTELFVATARWSVAPHASAGAFILALVWALAASATCTVVWGLVTFCRSRRCRLRQLLALRSVRHRGVGFAGALQSEHLCVWSTAVNSHSSPESAQRTARRCRRVGLPVVDVVGRPARYSKPNDPRRVRYRRRRHQDLSDTLGQIPSNRPLDFREQRRHRAPKARRSPQLPASEVAATARRLACWERCVSPRLFWLNLQLAGRLPRREYLVSTAPMTRQAKEGTSRPTQLWLPHREGSPEHDDDLHGAGTPSELRSRVGCTSRSGCRPVWSGTSDGLRPDPVLLASASSSWLKRAENDALQRCVTEEGDSRVTRAQTGGLIRRTPELKPGSARASIVRTRAWVRETVRANGGNGAGPRRSGILSKCRTRKI